MWIFWLINLQIMISKNSFFLRLTILEKPLLSLDNPLLFGYVTIC
jgi:hypothetical protein